MPQEPYHPLRRQFRSDALSDFCAVYYSTVTSFGHWEDFCSSEYSLVQRHWRNQNYHAAVRLFWARQKIERALELVGMEGLIRLGMFSRPSAELVEMCQTPIRSCVIDFWRRSWTGKIEVMVVEPSQHKLLHIACDLDKVKEALGIEVDDDLEDAIYANLRRLSVRVGRYKSVRYVSRIWVHVANIDVTVEEEPLRLSELSFMQHTPAFAAEVCKSLCVLNGELEFGPFLLYEAADDNTISELSFFSVESICVDQMVERDTTLDVRRKRMICTDFDGQRHSYVGLFRVLHRFRPQDSLRLLVKRRWGSGEAYILAVETIDQAELLQDAVRAEENDRAFRTRIDLLPVQAFLDELPEDGDLLPLASLSVGQEIEHADHGRGIIVARSSWQGRDEVKVKFYSDLRRHPTVVHAFAPDVRVASFWKNLKLTGVNPNE